jgi:ABC-type lipoprotein release transport system permease subunit
MAALAVALLAGWFPARQAAQLHVIEALHYE